VKLHVVLLFEQIKKEEKKKELCQSWQDGLPTVSNVICRNDSMLQLCQRLLQDDGHCITMINYATFWPQMTYSYELCFFVFGHALERVVLASQVTSQTSQSVDDDSFHLTTFSS